MVTVFKLHTTSIPNSGCILDILLRYLFQHIEPLLVTPCTFDIAIRLVDNYKMLLGPLLKPSQDTAAHAIVLNHPTATNLPMSGLELWLHHG